MKCSIGLDNCLECKHFDFDRNKCGYYKNIKKSGKKAFRKELRFRQRVKINTDQESRNWKEFDFVKGIMIRRSIRRSTNL
ncbi:hypothetical protein DRP04_03435 [Archaeoglobales archaeon]|nr:MAG: hypothetical protein DRP04_03435 [Archaeoglobales archaeon]